MSVGDSSRVASSILAERMKSDRAEPLSFLNFFAQIAAAHIQCGGGIGDRDRFGQAAQIYMLTAHLPRKNTIKDEDIKALAELFEVDYRKDFLN